jgi:hypothetical protein
MWEICFPDIGGVRHCIPIPVLLNTWPIPDPDPGPLRERLTRWVDARDPTPNPWKTDLVLLATVASLAELTSSPAVKEALGSVARAQVDRLAKGELPRGLSVNFGE